MDTLQSRWEAARGMIEHEDNLINHRYTWFFTLQGFLVTGLFLGVGALANGANKEHHGLIHLLLLLFTLGGSLLPWLFTPGIRAARLHIHATGCWWRQYGQLSDTEWAALETSKRFPPVKGPAPIEPGYDQHGISLPADVLRTRPWRSTYQLPYCVSGVWAIAFLIFLYSAINQAKTNPQTGTKVLITQDRQIDNFKVDFKTTP